MRCAPANPDQKWAKRISGVHKAQPLLDPRYPEIEPVQAIGHACILGFEDAKPRLHFTHVFTQSVGRSADMAKVLQHEIVCFHGTPGGSSGSAYHKALCLATRDT